MGNKESNCSGLKQFLVIVLILCRQYTYETRKKKKNKMEKWINFTMSKIIKLILFILTANGGTSKELKRMP